MSSGLPNRVDPFGELFATAGRGTLFGNRGGRFHRADRALGRARWAGRRWICCVLAFQGRRRRVWGEGYTELFFLDEASAFAAGHRPCMECRRVDATRFLALAGHARVDSLDRALDTERRDGRAKRTHPTTWGALPEGAVAVVDGRATLKRADAWVWTGWGWAPVATPSPTTLVPALTPPTTQRALAAGYRPSVVPPSEDIAP